MFPMRQTAQNEGQILQLSPCGGDENAPVGKPEAAQKIGSKAGEEILQEINDDQRAKIALYHEHATRYEWFRYNRYDGRTFVLAKHGDDYDLIDSRGVAWRMGRWPNGYQFRYVFIGTVRPMS
jgi:hypothetical protein